MSAVCRMHSAPAHRSTATAHHPGPVDAEMEADLKLEPEIAAAAGAPPSGWPKGVVLLTGATGFLGVYLLRDLLARTKAHVVCLVRAGSPDEARSRVEANLRRYEITLGVEQWRRVEAVPGDLAEPQLGLTVPHYAQLAARVDAVFHAAAVVNFYQTYRQVRGTNVGGAREILRFTVQTRVKELHFVSTTGVFDSDAGRGVVVLEADAPAHCHGSVMGYTQSKWVAEQLMLTARARGVPVSVYRTPFIMGDSRSGLVDEDNLVVKMLLGSIQGGAWPDEPTDVEMVPVDALSRAIAHLAEQPANRGRTFHITSPNPLRWADLGIAAEAYGYPLELVPYGEWKRRLAEFGRRKNNAMRPLLRLFTKVPPRLAAPVPEVFTRPPRPIFDSTVTQAALAPAGLVPPPMDHAMFATYLGFFVRRAWLPTPAEILSATLRPAKRSSGSHPPRAVCEPHA
jgi:thioester reductase-like protein